MPMSPNELYDRSTELLRALPEIELAGPLARTVDDGMARAYARVQASGDLLDAAAVRRTIDRIDQERQDHYPRVFRARCRVMAAAERTIPASARGGFALADSPLHALHVVSGALRTASREAMVVDTHLLQKIFKGYIAP